MAAGSPIAALAPARPASPLKALSFWGAGADPKPPPAFPAKMSKLWASTTAPGAIVHKYQRPAMVNAGLPGANLATEKGGGAGGWAGTSPTGKFGGGAGASCCKGPAAPRRNSIARSPRRTPERSLVRGASSRDSRGPTQAAFVALLLRCSASVRCNVSTKVASCGAYFSDATSRAVMERQPTGRLPTTSCIWPKA